jgi:hypothetical protein
MEAKCRHLFLFMEFRHVHKGCKQIDLFLQITLNFIKFCDKKYFTLSYMRHYTQKSQANQLSFSFLTHISRSHHPFINLLGGRLLKFKIQKRLILSLLLCVCETWSLALIEEYTFTDGDTAF